MTSPVDNVGHTPTPGPWRYDTGPALNGRHHSVFAADDETMVCECYEGTEKEQEANARLIAAAPELLEALEQVRAIITEGALSGFNPNDGTWATQLFDSQAMSATAVRKAGGDIRTKARGQV